jgi:hypothetical protein
MTYSIFSIGNSEFLYQVMNGMVRIFDFSNGGLSSFIAIASMLMLLGGLLGKIFNDKATPIKDWIFGLIFFFILSGPFAKADVEIISVRTGVVYTVDNVPLFAALGGYLTTSLTHLLSEEFQQSFAAINPSVNGLEPLRALTSIQNLGLSRVAIPGIPANYDPIGSIQNYLVDCFIGYKNLQNEKNIVDSAFKAAYMSEGWAAVHVPINTLTTNISLGTIYYNIGCKDAHAQIKSLWFDTEAFKNTIAAYLKSKGSNGAALLEGWNDTITANTPAAAAINQFKISEGILVNNMLQNAASSEGGSIYRSADVRVFEAKQERLFKMASERSMWMEMSIGMVSILESFIYFIAPLIAVLLVMGGMGLKALISYFGLVVWVNFWPISMMFVNLYTTMALEGKFSGIEGSASTFGLFDESMMTVESSIAFASQLTAMIPMLTLFILHRGVHTMMGVASQSAPNTFNGSAAAQSAQTTGEAGNYKAGNTAYALSGNAKSGYATIHTTDSGNLSPGLLNFSSSLKSDNSFGSDATAASKKSSIAAAGMTTANDKLDAFTTSNGVSTQSLNTFSKGGGGSHGAEELFSSKFDQSGGSKSAQLVKAMAQVNGKLDMSAEAGFKSGPNKDDKGKPTGGGYGGASIGGGLGFSMTADKMVSRMIDNNYVFAEGEADSFKAAYTETQSFLNSWSKGGTDGKLAAHQELVKESTAAKEEYSEALLEQSTITASSAVGLIQANAQSLEQSPFTAKIESHDQAVSYLNDAVDSMSDEEVLQYNNSLNLNHGASEDELKDAKGQKDKFAGYLEKRMGEEYKTLGDKTFARRGDREGVALTQAVLGTYRDVQNDLPDMNLNPKDKDAVNASAVNSMRETALELGGFGSMISSLGINSGDAGFISTGSALEGSAEKITERNQPLKNVENNTGVKLGEDFATEKSALIQKGTDLGGANSLDSILSKEEVIDLQNNVAGAKETATAKIAAFDLVKEQERSNWEKEKAQLTGALETADGLTNQLFTEQTDGTRGLFDTAIGGASSLVDALGGSGGPEERLATTGNYLNGDYSEKMHEGFQILAENDSHQVKQMLEDGFKPGATGEQREIADQIMFASSAEGQEIFDIAKNHYDTHTGVMGDGIDTKEWRSIDSNLNALNQDTDLKTAGVQNTKTDLLHDDKTKDNALYSMASADMFATASVDSRDQTSMDRAHGSNYSYSLFDRSVGSDSVFLKDRHIETQQKIAEENNVSGSNLFDNHQATSFNESQKDMIAKDLFVDKGYWKSNGEDLAESSLKGSEFVHNNLTYNDLFDYDDKSAIKTASEAMTIESRVRDFGGLDDQANKIKSGYEKHLKDMGVATPVNEIKK